MNSKSYKAIFFGTPDFSLPVLDALAALPCVELIAVVTQPDKPVGRTQALTSPPAKAWAIKHHVPVWQPLSLKDKKFIEQFKTANADVCIVVAYGKIIPAGLLDMPEYGWVNVHASLLPKYRGAAPIQAAILNGDTETGVTLMKIDAGLDTGPIITQTKVPLVPSENFATLHDKLSRLGADVVKKSLLPYLIGQLPAEKQDDTLATLTKIITKTDGRIDWKKPADEIDRHIRAYVPWPGAFCFWTPPKNNSLELRLKILEARPFDRTHRLLPGQTAGDNGRIIVGSGNGTLELIQVQLEGKKPLPIGEFIIGYPAFVQTVLS